MLGPRFFQLTQRLARLPNRLRREALAAALRRVPEPSRFATSRRKLDVLIPVIEKDLTVLPLAIESLRSHLRHPIGRIVVTSPHSAPIRDLARALGVEHRHEDELLPEDASQDWFWRHTPYRAGWLKQQLLKLNGCRALATDHLLVMDADTVFIRPVVFEHQGKLLLRATQAQHHAPYYASYRKLLGLEKRYALSFVTHHAPFERVWLEEMFQTIETRHGMAWHRAVSASLDRSAFSPFSEYETYGNFVFFNHPFAVTVLHWRHKELRRRDLRPPRDLARQWAANYRMVSFQHYHA